MDPRPTAVPARQGRWRLVLDIIATVAILLTCILLLRPALSQQRQKNGADRQSVPREPVSLEGAATLGARTAKVAIIEYSDFACPFSARFARDTLPMLRRTYIDTGKVLLAFRHLPLEKIHPTAMRAAEAAECAGNDGRFWAMHDHIFENPAQLDTGTLKAYLGMLGSNIERFGACMDSGLATAKIRKDAAGGAVLGLKGTPEFLVGTVWEDEAVKIVSRISGGAPYSTFSKLLDDLLAREEESAR